MSENDRRFAAVVNAFERLSRELDALEKRRSTEGIPATRIIEKMRASLAAERELVEKAFRGSLH